MIVYLTFGEYFSGIFSSQIIDVCNSISQNSGTKIKLVSFISIKNFFKERKKIKNAHPDALVLPMFPKIHNYKLNIIALFFTFLFYHPNGVVCRSAIAGKLGLMLRKLNLVKKVVFDGRAAEYEQLVEYNIIEDKKFVNDFFFIEQEIVQNADFRIAVSNRLVEYWKHKFEYNLNKHVVIPCTLNSSHQIDQDTKINRDNHGYNSEDIILIYSGSIAQWQSFQNLFDFLTEQLVRNEKIKVILLTKETPEIEKFVKLFANKVKRVWCKENEVFNYLSLADYGILIREDTWTNKVASPVKFAEYLYAGLNVIISQKVGDFSQFVLDNKCGLVYSNIYQTLIPINKQNKINNKELVNMYFSKKSEIIKDKYQQVINNAEIC